MSAKQHTEMHTPIFLTPGNRRVVVFGGGTVALRKCRHFEGFRLKVVATEVCSELQAIAGETILAEMDPETQMAYMEDADIVVAATSCKELNDAIVRSALSMGKMVNSAHGGGDVLIPTVLRRQNYSIAISSGGRAPAFPPFLADVLDGFLDPSYDLMVELLVRLRPEIRRRIGTQTERAAFFAGVLRNDVIWTLLREERTEEAYHMALEGVGTE